MQRLLIPTELSSYSQDHIFSKIILPLVDKYEEILWFADDHVAVTQEKTNVKQELGWTDALRNIGKIKSDSKGKYIELERMLSSIVFLHLFYIGSEEAYKKFISLQEEKTALSWNSFQSIHHLAKRVIKNPTSYEVIEAMLLYSDLGKTPKAREKAKSLGINCEDHDDWIEAVLSQDSPANVSKIIPSFFKLSVENKAFLKKMAMAMKIHLGHVAHLEGGHKMFEKFYTAVKNEMVDKNILDFVFLIQLCDVAASSTHENNQGSMALVEGWYQVYVIVNEVLEEIRKGISTEQALSLYVNKRGQQFNLNIEDNKEALLIRLSCLLRFYNKENSDVLKEIAKELSDSSWEVLKSQFDLFEGINTWNRNPTYIPTVLLNLAQLNSSNDQKHNQLSRALNGFICIAKLLNEYAQDENNKNKKMPLCFNNLAKLAIEQPEQFLVGKFDLTEFRVDEKNNYVFGKVPALSLRKNA